MPEDLEHPDRVIPEFTLHFIFVNVSHPKFYITNDITHLGQSIWMEIPLSNPGQKLTSIYVQEVSDCRRIIFFGERFTKFPA